MFEFFKKALASPQTEDGKPRGNDDIRVATCALFLEIASSDNEFSDEERQAILSILQTEYGLDEQNALELARASVDELKASIDVWQFTNRINENYSNEEKIRVVELLWRLVYIDGKLDAHEDYLMHKIGKLLRLPHRDLIAAKVKVLGEQT